MSLNKILLVLLISATSCALANNVTMGSREYGDELISSNYIQVPELSLRVLDVLQTFSINVRNKITLVRFIDLNRDGKGGQVSVTRGGPGYNYVSAKFTSQRGVDMEFTVELYGKIKY